MKKRFIPIVTVLLLAFIFIFTGCAENPYSEAIQTEFAPNEISAILSEFVSAHPDRTSFSGKEKEAAEYLAGKLEAYGAESEYQKFNYDYSYSGSILSSPSVRYTFESQNVIGRINGKNATNASKKVVIGANYDNLYQYSDLYEGYHRINNLNYTSASGRLGAEAALGATGVATALALTKRLAEYNIAVGLDYNVEIVFFGAELFGCMGSLEYTASAHKNDAMLYVNLYRLGGDNIYAYFDEVKTAHGELVMETADALGHGDLISEPTALHPTASATSSGGKLPYTNYALLSSAGVFFGNGIKVAAFTTGAWDSFVLSDSESLSYSNISETSNDTLAILENLCPQYSVQAAVVADTVFSSLTSGGLIAAVNADSYDYTWLTFPLAAALAVLGLIIIITFALVLIVKHFEKKYPFNAPKVKRVKMAVFGMDYENKEDADIFIDTKIVEPQDPYSHGKKPFDPFEAEKPPFNGDDSEKNE